MMSPVRRSGSRLLSAVVCAAAALLLLIPFEGLSAPEEPRLPGSLNGLPNYDVQAANRGGTLLTLGNEAAETRARDVLPQGTVIRYDPLTGAASRVINPDGAVSGPTRLAPAAVARRFLVRNPDLYHLSPMDVSSLRVEREYVSRNLGMTHVTVGQQYRGIPVALTTARFNIDSAGRVVSVGGSLVPRLARTVSATVPRITALEALQRAAFFAGIPGEVLGAPTTGPDGAQATTGFPAGHVFARPPIVELVYLPAGRGRTLLAWGVVLRAAESPNLYRVTVDAATGELLDRMNQTYYAHGQVFHRDSPQDGTPFAGGTPGVVSRVDRPFDGSDFFSAGDSHFDWWAGSAQTSSVSNNTRTGSDRDGNDNPTITQAASGDFSFSLDLTANPSNHQDASSTNLFYWVNRSHDSWYAAGFNEAAANMQASNLGLGGTGNDAVLALAQFDADSNAFFNPHIVVNPEGQSPIMRMYVADFGGPLRDGSFENQITSHEYMHAVIARLAGMGLGAFQYGSLHEGVADFAGLILAAEAADDVNGSYPVGGWILQDFANGVRSKPYSTNFSIFNRVYSQIGDPLPGLGSPEIHFAGEIICNALWDLYARLHAKYGMDAGRARVQQLLIAGLKQAPNSPTYLDLRDGMLAADLAINSRSDYNEIWAAFAKYGMGLSSSTTGPNDTNPTDGFDTPPPLNPNQPPTADAGADQVAVEFQRVTLDGSQSTDPDGDFIDLSWVQTAGPTIQLRNPSGPQPFFDAPLVPSSRLLTFQLTVSDGFFTATDSVGVTVNPAPNATATGRVLNQGGSPANGASVQAVRSDGQGSSTVTTDSSGQYLIPDVRAGNNVLTATLTGFDPGQASAFFPPGTTQNVDITLGGTSASLEGTIRLSNGTPAVDALVELLDGELQPIAGDVTNANGQYRIEGLDSATLSRVQYLRVMDSRASAPRFPEWRIGGFLVNRNTENTRNLQYAALTVKVVGKTGGRRRGPIAGANVEVLIGDQLIGSGVTGQAGTFAVEQVPATLVRVRVTKPGVLANQVERLLGQGEKATVKVTLPGNV